jgi:hypothetical protein
MHQASSFGESYLLWLDESVRGEVLTVGGVMMRTADEVRVVDAWRALKERMGLDAFGELKHALNEKHPSRPRLDAAGWTQKHRVPGMLEMISKQPVLVIVATRVDNREGDGRPHPEDYYLDALMWCAMRFCNAMHRDGRATQGPHRVTVDYPTQPDDLENRQVSARLRELYSANPTTAAFQRYERAWASPTSTRDSGTMPALRRGDLAPSLAATHSQHCDLLQMADVVTGTTNEFVAWNLAEADGSNLPWPSYRDKNFQKLRPVVRRSPGGALRGYGFGLLPEATPAQQQLMEFVEDERAVDDACA